jgi:hypothetical protein
VRKWGSRFLIRDRTPSSASEDVDVLRTPMGPRRDRAPLAFDSEGERAMKWTRQGSAVGVGAARAELYHPATRDDRAINAR